MASTKILSFSTTDGVTKKITNNVVFKVSDLTSRRELTTSIPTQQFYATDSLSDIKTNAGNLFSATESGVDILLNALYFKDLDGNGSGCDIYFQGGEKVTVDESVSVIEGRINALSPEDVNTPIEDPSPPTTLDSSNYYSLTNSGTYTIEDAATTYNASNAFQMQIKNASGGNITIQRSSTNTFYGLSGSVTSFTLADGEFVTLTAATTSRYDIN